MNLTLWVIRCARRKYWLTFCPTPSSSPRLMLQQRGSTVVENGEQAVDRVKCHAFDVVLMDLQMHQMDGLNATRHIRALQNIQQPKIIALTANAMPEDRDRCIAAGMNGCLSKPIRLKDLQVAIAPNV
jgi:CheY-like chemotaxis protein